MPEVVAELEAETVMRLRSALLVYQGGERVFVTSHQVAFDEAGRARLEEGRLLETRQYEQLARTVAGPARYLQEHLLAYNAQVMVWFVPARARVMYFQTDDPFLNELSGQNLPQPPLVFKAERGGLAVYALLENVRPTPETQLCRAPYFNVSDWNVCLGTTRLPGTLEPDSAHAFAEAFFASAFTHGTGTLLSRGWGGSYGELLRHSQATGRFPSEHLRPLDLTLKGLIERA